MAIQSFRCLETAAIFAGKSVKRFRAIQTVAERKLQMLDSAVDVLDLRSPPGNRLERLQGDRSGFYSIRINDQWRLCFNWTKSGPAEVEIVDYH